MNQNWQLVLRRVVLSAAILAVILAFSLLGLHPPHGRPVGAPPREFSAARALNALHRVLPDDVPHPIGSAADDAVRVRILAELTRLGYQPVVHTAFACSEFGACGTVNNVLARLDGTEPGHAVLLSAHYDSVPAGPGDSDDGVGVASVLEIARALKTMPRPLHTVILLIDDGEEVGLLGARAFVDTDPWAKEVRADVNLDNRGTSGPSLMFETGTANDWALRLYANDAARHLTSSIFYSIYKLLPNDSDFTVFKQAGYQGLNFALIGRVALYHTPLDNSANISVASLQDEGSSGLASIVALANASFPSGPATEAVYFDLFGRRIIHWTTHWTLGIAILCALLLMAEIAWLVHKQRVTFRQFIWGFVGWIAAIAGAGIVGLVLRVVLAIAGATPVRWVAHPLPAEIAFALVGIAIVIGWGSLVARVAGFWGLWTGMWAWGAILSIVAGVETPGFSYIVLAPTVVALAGGIAAVIDPGEHSWTRDLALLLPLASSAIVQLPLILLLYRGMGNQALVGIALAVTLLVTPLFPLCADLQLVRGIGGIALRWSPLVAVALAGFAAVVVPVYSAKSPERVNYDYALDADSGMARWLVYPDSGHLQTGIQLAGAFQRSIHGAFPWDTHSSFFAAAPHLDLAAPTFTVLDSSLAGDRRQYTALLRSERGAPESAILFPPGANVQSVRVEGQTMDVSQRTVEYFNGWTAYSLPSIPAAGINMLFTLPVGKMVEVTAIDRSFGLPSVGAFLASARPLAATPSQDGDVTVVYRRVQLFP